MNNHVFFYQIAAINESQCCLSNLLEKDIQYSYFNILNEYFIFGFSQKKDCNLNKFHTQIHVYKLLNRRKRLIRSLRGFFLYALKFIKNKDCKILNTNLPPLFWLEVEPVLRQNRNDVLICSFICYYEKRKFD